MLVVLALATALPLSVRAELVEALPFSPEEKSSPSTSSGRTGDGYGGSQTGERAPVQTALDAERAFAADALKRGQWTAFRAWAAPDAIMFVPQPVNAQSWLRARQDPASTVTWQASASFVSCDGATAINTGPWQRPGSVGYFTTVWRRQPAGGWKWLLDFGGTLTIGSAAAGAPRVTTASCSGTPSRQPLPAGTTGGTSADGTLRWWYTVLPNGGRTLAADYWDGAAYHPALADQELAG